MIHTTLLHTSSLWLTDRACRSRGLVHCAVRRGCWKLTWPLDRESMYHSTRGLCRNALPPWCPPSSIMHVVDDSLSTAAVEQRLDGRGPAQPSSTLFSTRIGRFLPGPPYCCSLWPLSPGQPPARYGSSCYIQPIVTDVPGPSSTTPSPSPPPSPHNFPSTSSTGKEPMFLTGCASSNYQSGPMAASSLSLLQGAAC